jgi:hypothetical protein
MLNYKSSLFHIKDQFTKEDVQTSQKIFFFILGMCLLGNAYSLIIENLYYKHLNPLPLFSFLKLGKLSLWPYIMILSSLIILCFYNVFRKSNKYILLIIFLLYFYISGNAESHFTRVIGERFFHAKIAPLYGIFIFLLYSFSKKIKAYWPILLLHCSVCLVYFGPSFERIKRSGLPGWFSQDSFQAIMLNSWLTNDSKLALWIAQNDLAIIVAPLFTLIFESTFFITILFPALLPFYLVAAIIFHLLAELSIEAYFIFFFATLYSCFFNKTYLNIILRRSK